MANQPPLVLQPTASMRLAVFLLGSHLLAGLVVVFLPALPWWGRVLLFGFIAVSALYYWRLHISRSAEDAVQEVRVYCHDNALLRTQHRSHWVRLDASSFLQPWLCVLNWRTQRGKLHTLIVLPDSVPPELFRQLRVRIQFDTAT